MADENEKPGGSGNLADDRERASKAGQKGGEHSRRGQQNQQGQQGDGSSSQQGGRVGTNPVRE